MELFTTQRLSARLVRITDRIGVCCYLVIGDESACLLDTCTGFGNIRSCVEALTDKPVFVVLTHGHYDHIGGAGLFDQIYLAPADLPVYQKHSAPCWREALRAKNPTVQGLPEEALPPYADMAALLPLADGQVFDLGGVMLRMLAVPGHTPGMMCPLLAGERTIIFGDACGTGVLLFDEFSSTVSEYRRSLLRLKAHESEYDTVYRNHGSFWSDKDLLDNVIECCDHILAGTDAREPVREEGADLLSACRLVNGQRADGKQGNIKYLRKKAI